MENIEIVENIDNEYLGPSGGGCLVIGCVDEVNGAGAQEAPEFVPTHHELLRLAKHWERVRLREEYFMYWSGTVGSDILRRQAFAQRRLNRIAEVIGGVVMERAVNEVRKEFGKKCDRRTWDYFQSGLLLPKRVAERFAYGEEVTEADWDETDLR